MDLRGEENWERNWAGWRELGGVLDFLVGLRRGKGDDDKVCIYWCELKLFSERLT